MLRLRRPQRNDLIQSECCLKFAATEESKHPVLEKVKSVIEEHAGSEIKINSDDELKGEGLFYGIQLSRLCMTLDDGSGPSELTQTPGERPGSNNKLAAH